MDFFSLNGGENKPEDNPADHEERDLLEEPEENTPAQSQAQHSPSPAHTPIQSPAVVAHQPHQEQAQAQSPAPQVKPQASADNLLATSTSAPASPAPLPFSSSSTTASPFLTRQQIVASSAPLQEWEREQSAKLDAQRLKEQEEKKALQKKAGEELKNFYVERNEKRKGTRQKNLNIQSAQTSAKSGTGWQEVNNLVDLTEKSRVGERDVSRMRHLIIELKSS